MAKSTKTTDTVENVTVTAEAVESVTVPETTTAIENTAENIATEDNTVVNKLSKNNGLYYTKKQLLSNNNYKRYADLINVLFEGNKEYTKKQVDELLNKEVR